VKKFRHSGRVILVTAAGMTEYCSHSVESDVVTRPRHLAAVLASLLPLSLAGALLVARAPRGEDEAHASRRSLASPGGAAAGSLLLAARGAARSMRRRLSRRDAGARTGTAPAGASPDADDLRSMLDAGHLLAFSWDIASGRVRHLTGSGDTETTFEAVVAGVHPDDRDAFLRRIRAALEGGSEYAGEYRERRPDGSVAWVLDRGRVIFDETGTPVRLAGVAFDITHRKDAEAELERRRREAEVLADVARTINASQDTATILPAIAEAARVLLRCDGARVALLDHARNAMLLRYTVGAPTVMAPGFAIGYGVGIGGLAWAQDAVVRSADFATDGRFGPDYLSIVLADGIVSCMVAPIRIERRVEGLIYANNLSYRPFTDEDERILVTLADHAAVAVRNAEVLAREQAARAEAEAGSRAKDEFLAMLGHELRNPLGAIASAAHLLDLAEDDPVRRQRAREIIERQTTHLARLVDDLLDSARVATGKIALDRTPLDLAQVVHQCVAALTGTSRADGRTITADARPAWVAADATRAEQIVMNLLANALKYTPAGGRIAIRTRRERGDAVLEVEDTGVGIDPALLPRIFDLFVQGDRGLDRATGGLGIGLTLVRQLVELHGGSIRAESEGAGRGSRFTVRLPGVSPPEVRLGERRPRAAAGAARTVLVVDDNDDAREMLREILRAAGHTVYEAADGPSALEVAQARHFDVALVDIGLPGLDGYEVARRLRASAEGTLLVALTGYGQRADRERATAAGFDHHIVKPVDPDALLAMLSDPARA
jgi:PAS domain S-box-containing protein